MTAAEALIQRIDIAVKQLSPDSEDRRVLSYVRRQITPKGLDKRSDEDQNVTHLYEVANDRLRRVTAKEIDPA